MIHACRDRAMAQVTAGLRGGSSSPGLKGFLGKIKGHGAALPCTLASGCLHTVFLSRIRHPPPLGVVPRPAAIRSSASDFVVPWAFGLRFAP